LDHGFAFKEENVITNDLEEESGERIVEKILQLKPRPDGLLVSNDTCAASCLIALKKKNIKIPEDIAIVGFNNDLISRMVEPNLSTVNYPSYHMGEVAMKNLINHLDEAQDEILQKTNTITLRHELIVRGSSKR
jgi:LacI family transcriptional regulator